MDFLSLPNRSTILFTLHPTGGALVPMYDFPEGCKSNVFYFVKLTPVEVTQSNCESILISGEISANPIEDLKAITENVSTCCVRFAGMS